MQHEQGTLATLWRFIRPEPEELIFYILSIVVMLGIAGYRVAVQGQLGSDSLGLIDSLHAGRTSLFSIFDTSDTWGKFFLFGLWFLIGTITYIIAWSLITMLVDLSKDIQVSSSFVHPNSFHKSDYWIAIVARVILRVAGGGALLFYMIFWLAAFAPVWISSFQSAFGHGLGGGRALDMLSAFIGIAFSLHIAAILFRLMLLRAHYSYET